MSRESGTNFPTLISAKQLSSILGISQRTQWRLRASGQLPKSVKISHSVRWKAEEVVAWIDSDCPCLEDWEAMTSSVAQ